MPARCLAGCGWAGLASIEEFASRLDLAKVGELKDLDTAARSASLQMSHAEVPGAGGAVHGTHQGGARSSSANCRPARVGSCGPHGLWGSSFFFLFCPVPAPTEAMPGEEARADSRTAVPEALRHSLLLQEEIAKMSDNKSEEKGEEPQGGSLQRWQGPYWWKSLKGKTAPR